MAMTGGGKGGVKSDINITPLVDVVSMNLRQDQGGDRSQTPRQELHRVGALAAGRLG